MSTTQTEWPSTLAIIGFGEAGSAITEGLVAPNGWCDASGGRRLLIVDTAYGEGPRGLAMRSRAERLGVTVHSDYDQALSDAELVISVVTGTEAVAAARMAGPWLPAGALYADYNSITGQETRDVASVFADQDVDFIDVAVMGSFLATGHRTPLLLSGQRCPEFARFAAAIGASARILGDGVGDASAVKILRSVLMKGIEALSIECLVAARRQGLVDAVLDNIGDVDALGLAEFIRVLTISHLIHAERRMEEVEKAIANLHQTGVPSLMSDATLRSHRRTVDAKLDIATIDDFDLHRALELLDRKIISDRGES